MSLPPTCSLVLRGLPLALALLAGCSPPSGDQPACASGTPQAMSSWTLAGLAPHDYAIGIDSAVSQSGQPTEWIEATDAAPTNFGTVMQTVPPTSVLGQRLTFRAVVKTSHIATLADGGSFSNGNGPGEAGLWMRVDGHLPNDPLAFYNMSDHPLVGSQDWATEEVTLDVPSDATRISFGLWINGPGQVWLDQSELVSCAPASAAPASTAAPVTQ